MIHTKSYNVEMNTLSTDKYGSRKYVSMKGLICVFFMLIALILSLTQPIEYVKTAIFYSLVIIIAVMFAALAQNAKTAFFFNIYFFLSFLTLFFVLGFRNYSGIDDISYIRTFYDVIEYGWWERFKVSTMEPGYLILNYLVSLFTENYIYMQLISSFIPLALFYYAFKKNKSNISLPMAIFLLCTMLYFQMLSVSLVRMFIAISIVFNAYTYILQKRPIKYIALILLASMFHYSAFFMVVFGYFSLNNKNISKRANRFILVLFILIPIIFIAVSKLLVPLLGARYAAYGVLGSLQFEISSLDTVPLLILLIYFYKKVNYPDKDYLKLFLVIFIFSSILSFYSSLIPLGRLIFYVNSAFFIAAPMVSKKLNDKLLFNIIIILYGFVYVYWTQFTLESHIPYLFPYQNLFFTV